MFKNQSHQQQFDEKGYVILPLFQPEQVQHLLDLYYETIPQDQVSGLYESSRNNTAEVNHRINQALFHAFETACAPVFKPCQLYGGTFMVKSRLNSEVLPLHQDWSVVEEEQFDTLFIWCPLIDVGAHNGGLFVLEGSHRYFQTLRSGSYPSNRYVLPPALHDYVRDISLKAGEAILYSDQLFHGSHANNSDGDRIVATAQVMQADARLVYFHKADDSTVDVYEGSADFYLTQIDRIARGQKPVDIPKLYSRPYRHVPITDAALHEKIREHFAPSNNDTAMPHPIFKNAGLQREFDENGFVVIDLIDRGQVAELLDFYNSLQNEPAPGNGFQVSLDNENPEFVRRISTKLIETVEADVGRQFENHRIFTASFVVKEPNPVSLVPPHQDWTFVDENHFYSATIWCPLVDVDRENGGLGAIKGSHLLYDHVRPSPSPQFAPPFHNQMAAVIPYLKIIDLKAGQALVFNNKTIHGSLPNYSGQTRVAFGIGVTQQEAALRHYYLLPNQEKPLMEAYEVAPDFFLHYNNARLKAMYEAGEKPAGLNSVGVFLLQPKQFENDALEEQFRAAGNTADENLAAQAAALFSHGYPSANPPSAALPFWKVYTPLNIYREIKYRLEIRKRAKL